jgi:hypothetical protein
MTDTGKDAPKDDAHIALLRHFEEAFDNTSVERELAERDRDYYDGKQLTEEEEATLRERRQPIVISNRIRPKIDALLGFERKQRTDPKAFPRTPKHEEDANSVTDALRFVCDQNRFQQLRSDVAESMFVEGIGAATVTVKPSRDGFDVVFTAVPWDRFYRDPHSRKRDFSDAAYMGVVLWMDEADVKAEFKDAEQVIEACYDTTEAEGQTYDDRPSVSWADKKRKRVRVLQHRWREAGVWKTAILTKGGFLRPPQEIPYKDEDGKPECDLVAVSCYIDRENRRYGHVRNMISAQDEINKRRSKALHRLSVQQVVAEAGAVENVAFAKAELAKPDGYIEIAPGMQFEIQRSEQLAMGELELYREAKAEIDASGVNPALQGDIQAPSGRAVEALTSAGLAETAIAFDALRDWSLRVYKQAWNRIKQYWTGERWVRVTDDERNLRWVGLNRQITPEALAQEGRPVPPGAMPGQVLGVENQLAELDVDIVVDEAPDSVVIQSEQFAQLVELKKADPAAIPTQAIIEASSLRNKDAILKHLEQGGVPPELAQKMQEMQQALQECQQQLAEAKADQQGKQGDLAVKAAELQLKDREIALKEAERELKLVELQIKQFEAETDRIQALKPDPQPVIKED